MKNNVIIVVIVILMALGLAWFGRTSNKLETGITKVQQALAKHQAIVVAVTDGTDRKYMRGLREEVRQQPAGKVALVQVNKRNPIEKDTIAQFPKLQPPFMAVLGVDGHVIYQTPGQYDREKVRLAIEEGLKREPLKHTEGGGREH